MPGDNIEIAGMEVLVNGESIRKETVGDLDDKNLNTLLDGHVAFREKSEGGSYLVIWKKNKIDREDLTFTVPNGLVLSSLPIL